MPTVQQTQIPLLTDRYKNPKVVEPIFFRFFYMIRTDGSTIDKHYKTAKMIASYFKILKRATNLMEKRHFQLDFGLYCRSLLSHLFLTRTKV